jgi:hypothetical protein
VTVSSIYQWGSKHLTQCVSFNLHSNIRGRYIYCYPILQRRQTNHRVKYLPKALVWVKGRPGATRLPGASSASSSSLQSIHSVLPLHLKTVCGLLYVSSKFAILHSFAASWHGGDLCVPTFAQVSFIQTGSSLWWMKGRCCFPWIVCTYLMLLLSP